MTIQEICCQDLKGTFIGLLAMCGSFTLSVFCFCMDLLLATSLCLQNPFDDFTLCSKLCVTTFYHLCQGKYGGCFPYAYNANKGAWYMSRAADWWMLFLLHENQQCLHCDCSQQ